MGGIQYNLCRFFEIILNLFLSNFVVLSVDLLRRRETNLCFDKIFCLGWGCPRADDELSLPLFTCLATPVCYFKMFPKIYVIELPFLIFGSPNNTLKIFRSQLLWFCNGWMVYHNIFNHTKLLILLVKRRQFLLWFIRQKLCQTKEPDTWTSTLETLPRPLSCLARTRLSLFGWNVNFK